MNTFVSRNRTRGAVILACLSVCAAVAVVSTCTRDDAASARMPLGINIEGSNDWGPLQMWANVMMQARPWGSVAKPHDRTSPLDENGWPQGDAGTYIITDIRHIDGTYKLSFRGDATVTAVAQSPSGSVQIRDKVYDAASNRTTADVVVASGAKSLVLTFQGQEGGVKDVKLMRPGHAETEIFNRAFLDRLSRFSLLRFMPYQGTSGQGVNGNGDVSWADRTRPTWATANRPNGGSFEHMIVLANQLEKDVWVTVPPKANDEYITKMATLFKYGADADGEPYSAPQANPVYPPLRAGAKLYVEFCNEVWNRTFASTNENQMLAKTELGNGDPYHYGAGSDFDVGLRRMARRSAEVSLLFRAVFGDAEMMERVRPVLASQYVNAKTFSGPLEYLDAVYGPSNPYDNRKLPLNQYFYGVAGAPYVVVADETREGMTLDEVFAQMSASVTALIGHGEKVKAAADKYGLKFLAYEGGPGLRALGSKDIKLAAQNDPRMKGIVLDLIHRWRGIGGELFVYYTLSTVWGSFGYFGLSDDITSEETPKWEAIKELTGGM